MFSTTKVQGTSGNKGRDEAKEALKGPDDQESITQLRSTLSLWEILFLSFQEVLNNSQLLHLVNRIVTIHFLVLCTTPLQN